MSAPRAAYACPRARHQRQPRPGLRRLGLALRPLRRRRRPGRRRRVCTSTSRGRARTSVPRDEHHLVVRSLRTAFDLLGGAAARAGDACANRIPHGRGLGSSSAAICAGIVAARALVTDGEPAARRRGGPARSPPRSRATPTTSRPACSGGFTLAWTDGRRAPGRSGWSPTTALVRGGLRARRRAARRETARGLLPAAVPHADAAANAGRAALLVEALTRRPELLLPATEDRLHQEYRAPAMPGAPRWCDRLRADGVAAVDLRRRPDGARAGRRTGAADRCGRLAGAGWAANRLRRRPGGAVRAPPLAAESVRSCRAYAGDAARGGHVVGPRSVKLEAAPDARPGRCVRHDSGSRRCFRELTAALSVHAVPCASMSVVRSTLRPVRPRRCTDVAVARGHARCRHAAPAVRRTTAPARSPRHADRASDSTTGRRASRPTSAPGKDPS